MAEQLVLDFSITRKMPRAYRGARLYEYRGASYSISKLAALNGITPEAMSERIKRGWSVERAVETPYVPTRVSIGDRFGKLIITAAACPCPKGRPQWACLCDCGKSAIVAATRLISGNTKGCGCTRGKYPRPPRNRLIDQPEFGVWANMRARTCWPGATGYRYYGGRGITICDRWLSGDGEKSGYQCFVEDMGPRPKGATIDRINPNGNYEKDNCRWDTSGGEVQANNRRDNVFVTYLGETKTIAQWSRHLGIGRDTLEYRIEHWPLELAMTKPVQAKKDRGK